MSQNTSHAVMAQRVEPHDSLDYFPTPPWATRALCEWIAGKIGRDHMRRNIDAWEPACGEGHMVRPLREYFANVRASDVRSYGCDGQEVVDFLFCPPATADWIITNPPFRLAKEFALEAMKRAPNVALLVRTAFLEGGDRFRTLFDPCPPTAILQFSERVPMHKGRLVENGSTATAYCWVIWRKTAPLGCSFDWIPPSRRSLERDGDYPAEAA